MQQFSFQQFIKKPEEQKEEQINEQIKLQEEDFIAETEQTEQSEITKPISQELINQEIINPALEIPKEREKRKINFEDMPENTDKILKASEQKQIIDKFTQDQSVAIPMESSNTTSYLSLVLSPNLRDLELMIRGLEYVKRFNPILGRDEIVLKKIEGHPLNENGVNKIMQELKVFSSPEIKLGRKRERDYYNSVQHVCHSIVRLIYKNLKNFGMDTQVKQRNAKSFCNAIIEIVDASYSRSVEGKENDLSRATEFKIEGSIDSMDPSKLFNKQQKEQLKN